MSFEWITNRGVLGSWYENEEISTDILYNSDDENTELSIISGALPNGVAFGRISNGHYRITGVLPSVTQSTIYDFTVRASTSTSEYYDRYFTIIIESYDVNWESPTLFATTTEYAYLSEYFKLTHPNGNEIFKKVSGELPEGIQINKFGLCYGTIGHIEESTDYRFRVGVFIGDYELMFKDFIIQVKTLAELQQPIWITQEGNIGKLNYRSVSNLKLNVYEPNNLPLEFTITNGALPTGLSLNSSNGAITGMVETENNVQWNFTVSCTNGYKSIERTFNIITNEVNTNDNITWITDENLGSVKIGSNFYGQIETESNYPVRYDVVSGNFPAGINMTNKGMIYGRCDYQEQKEYAITIHAVNEKTEAIKTFYLTVEQGLGKNALRAYLYFNLEHQPMYNELKGMFRNELAYHSYDKNFLTPYKPEIYVADIACYDKPLLQKLLQYDTYLMLTGEHTVEKKYIVEDSEEELIDLYDVYYKTFKASNRSPEEEYIEYKSSKHYVKPLDGGWVDYYTGEPVEVIGTVMSEEVNDTLQITYLNDVYDVGYIQEGMYYTTEESKVVFGNPEIGAEIEYDPITQHYITKNYYFDGTEKIYITQNEIKRYYDKHTLKVMFDVDINIVTPVQTTTTMYYFRDSNIIYSNIPSIETMRTRLTKKIYVKELTEDAYYDMNSEEFLDPIYNKVYDLIWDDEKQAYYFQQDQMPYVQLACYDTTQFDPKAYVYDEATGQMWAKVYIYDKSEFGDIYVKYHYFDVVNMETGKVYRNMIFRIDGVPYPFMIDSYGHLRFVKHTDITQRKYYWFDKNINDIDSNNLVLENINDEDILDDGQKYIQFFDYRKEQLPEWMEGKYIPKIDVFYSIPGESNSEYAKVIKQENKIDLFNKMDFSFYCLTFVPKYNLDIAPFDVELDYHSYPSTPHTLIPTHSN